MSTQSLRACTDRTCRFRQVTSGWRLALELTRRCNLGCRHCFVPHTDQCVPVSAVHSLLDDARAAGCRKVIVTGGEPLLYRDLASVVARCGELGLLADLNTNAIALSRRTAEALAEASLREASVSLYGRRHNHAALTGDTSAFDRTLRGIRHLRKAEVTVDVHCPVWTDNLPDLQYVLRTCERLGCASLTFFTLIGTSGRPLSPAEALERLQALRAGAAIPIRSVGLASDDWSECVMGSGIVGVTAALELTPCLLAARRPNAATRPLKMRDLANAVSTFREEVGRGLWTPACSAEARRADP
jgi:pyruvate-formate lyase-activating enzyme